MPFRLRKGLCSVEGCGECTQRYLYPRVNNLRSVWVERVFAPSFREHLPKSLHNHKVCGKHFHPACKLANGKLIRGAVPSLSLPYYSLPEGQTELEAAFAGENKSHPHVQDVPLLDAPTASSRLSPTNIPQVLRPERVYHGKRKIASVAAETAPVVEPAETEASLPMVKSRTCGRTGMQQHFKSGSNTVGKIRKICRASGTSGRKSLALMKKNGNLLNYLEGVNESTLHFFKCQLRNQKLQPQGRRFTLDDKVFALSLYKQNGKSYKFLSQFFSLPSRRTLAQILQSIPIFPGINEHVFEHLRATVSKLRNNDRYCVMMFDEISLQPGLQYSKRLDFVEGFLDLGGGFRRNRLADHAVVFMVKGIRSGWKQPVFFGFCEGTTATVDLVRLIKDLVRRLYDIGLNVVASVCDQGSTNRAAINTLLNDTRAQCLRSGEECRYVGYVIDGREVVPIFDPPHLLKGIRNALLTKDLHFTQDGKAKVARWSHIMQLHELDQQQGPYRQCIKLTDEHVLPHKIRKMKVKVATQVFSRTVAAAMYSRASVSSELSKTSAHYLDPSAKDTADLLLFFDMLFDSVNGHLNNPPPGKPLRCAVKSTSNHVPFWQTAIPILKSMQFVSKNSKTITPSLSNWITTTNGFLYLWKRLQGPLKTISPRNFNQDPLENFFSQIRNHSARNPTCSSFTASYKTLLVNNLSSSRSVGANCEEDESNGLLTTLKSFVVDQKEVEMMPVVGIVRQMEIPSFAVDDFATPYVAGFVAKRFFRTFSCNSCRSLLEAEQELPENVFVHLKEYEGHRLFRPSSNFTALIRTITNQALQVLPDLLHQTSVMQKLLDFIKIDDFLCPDHIRLQNYFFKIVAHLILFSYVKKLNSILRGKIQKPYADPLLDVAAAKCRR